jgi:hypothetical protein
MHAQLGDCPRCFNTSLCYCPLDVKTANANCCNTHATKYPNISVTDLRSVTTEISRAGREKCCCGALPRGEVACQSVCPTATVLQTDVILSDSGDFQNLSKLSKFIINQQHHSLYTNTQSTYIFKSIHQHLVKCRAKGKML